MSEPRSRLGMEAAAERPRRTKTERMMAAFIVDIYVKWAGMEVGFCEDLFVWWLAIG